MGLSLAMLIYSSKKPLLPWPLMDKPPFVCFRSSQLEGWALDSEAAASRSPSTKNQPSRHPRKRETRPPQRGGWQCPKWRGATVEGFRRSQWCHGRSEKIRRVKAESEWMKHTVTQFNRRMKLCLQSPI